jgi:PucR family transcriptional regulator, purine catabolism regulatory protein
MYRSVATIEDVYRLALPPATRMLTGREYLGRSVSWACSLRPSPPAFPKLDGNELALIDMADLRQLDPKMSVERVVRGLEDARIAALAVLGDLDDSAIAAARTSRIPLFQLPRGAPLTQIERAVIRLIVDRSGYIAQRSSDLQRELNQIALDGGGLGKIADHLHRFSSAPVIIVGEDGRAVASAGVDASGNAQPETIIAALPNTVELRSWAAAQSRALRSEAIGVLPMGENGTAQISHRQVVVSPIIANESVRGFCMLLRSAQSTDQEISAVEEIAVKQGASASALEWAKQNAVGVAEERMRAAFLDELLASEIADEAAWIQRGSSLGYDMGAPHAAWFIEARGVANWPRPMLDFADTQKIRAPSSLRSEGLLLFWPIGNPRSARELKEVASRFVAQMTSQAPNAQFVIGIGRPANTPLSWVRSQQQARESWRLGKQLNGAPITYFGDLGLYQLLTSLGTNPEAARFFRKTMGLLIAHDDNKNAELVETLEAFFACHGNLSQTSICLHIHRNTLSYRLDQIESVANLDLNDPDARFSLQLALKLRPLMK